MREIKFRGMRVDNDEWVYGCLINNTPDGRIFIQEDIYSLDPKQIKKDTVGQFTGLYDANGKEIYEGDCFKDKYEDLIDVVVFERGCFFLKTYSWAEVCLEGNAFESKWWCWDLQPIYDYDLTKDEIIGNIHDNPGGINGNI